MKNNNVLWIVGISLLVILLLRSDNSQSLINNYGNDLVGCINELNEQMDDDTDHDYIFSNSCYKATPEVIDCVSRWVVEEGSNGGYSGLTWAVTNGVTNPRLDNYVFLRIRDNDVDSAWQNTLSCLQSNGNTAPTQCGDNICQDAQPWPEQSSDGNFIREDIQVCPQDCDVSNVCDPGSQRCHSTFVEQCNSAGNDWDFVEACGTNDCVSSGGQAMCVQSYDTCTPNEIACNGQNVERCTENGGVWSWLIVDTCGDGDVCTELNGGAECRVVDNPSCDGTSLVGNGDIIFVGNPRLETLNGQSVVEIELGDTIVVEQDFRVNQCGRVFLEAGIGRVGGLQTPLQTTFSTSDNCNGDTTNFANKWFNVPSAGTHTVKFSLIPERFGGEQGTGVFSAYTAHLTGCNGNVLTSSPINIDNGPRFKVNPVEQDSECGDGEWDSGYEDCDFDNQANRYFYEGNVGCSDFGNPSFTSGVLRCSSECKIQTSSCGYTNAGGNGGSPKECNFDTFPANIGKTFFKDDCEDAQLVGWLMLIIGGVLIVALLKGAGKR